MFSSVSNWFSGKGDEEKGEKTETPEKSGPGEQERASDKLSSDKVTSKETVEAKAEPDRSAVWDSGEDNKKSQSPRAEGDEAESGKAEATGTASATDSDKDKANIEDQIDEVKEKALHAAKEWGSYLFNVGKAATKQVADAADKVKNKLEEKTILGEFHREQKKFSEEQEETRRNADAAVPPWVGYSQEQEMKTQILALSQDKRNFLRNPPKGVQFNFDYASCHKVAVATLQEDPKLQKMRFELVPKQITEEAFWKNYFYRVSLIKQSTQLTSLAMESGTQSGDSTSGDSEKELAARLGGATPEATTGQTSPAPARVRQDSEDAVVVGSPPAEEFVSEDFSGADLSGEELRREMEQLGMAGDKSDGPPDELDLEAELQQELADYDTIPDVDDDDALEAEILRQLEESENQ